jgi:hypothetical protein
MSIPAPGCVACIPTRAVPQLARQGITSTRITHTISTDNAQANSRLAHRHPQIIQHQLSHRFLFNYDTNALPPFLSDSIELVRVKQLDAHSRAHESAPALVQIEAALSWSQQRARHDPTNPAAI